MIYLSFDIEEFDVPLEYNGTISFEEQIAISRQGVQRILKLLDRYQFKATFFSTVIFAENNSDLIAEIIANGHELASHTYYHSQFSEEDLEKSRLALEALSGTKIYGLRMPRMKPVSAESVQKAGYAYNASVNPTWLPGRYDNRHMSRLPFTENGLLQIPASVTPRFRIPLFWLSFHNFPLPIYFCWLGQILKNDGMANLYFHPWEFSDISSKTYKLPRYTTINTNGKMVTRFEKLLKWLQEKGVQSGLYREILSIER